MSAALVPLLLVLAVAVSVLAASNEALSTPSAAVLLAAPLLSIAGARLRAVANRSPASAFLGATAQVALGTLLLGGVLYIGLGLGLPAAVSAGGALVVGLALSLADGPAALRPFPRAVERPTLEALVASHALLTVPAGVVALAFLARLLPEGSPRTVSAVLIGGLVDLAKGLVAGVAAGVAAAAVSSRAAPGLPRAALQLAAGLAAAAGGAAAEGSPLLAALAAGWIAAGKGNAPDPSSGHADEGAARASTEPVPFAGADVLALAAGAALLLLAAEEIDPKAVRGSLLSGLELWAGASLLRVLVQAGFGGVLRWRRPWDLPARWLPALAWASHAGPVAVAFYLIALESAPQRRGLLGGPRDPEAAAFLTAIAVGLLVQGATSEAALRWAGGALRKAPGRKEWERWKAVRIALRAQRRAVEQLRVLDEIDAEAATALADALDSAERRAASASELAAVREPGLRAAELARAARTVLAAGRDAVALARSLGQVEGEAAIEVERELEAKRSRSGALPLRQLFDGGDADDSSSRTPSGEGRR